MKLSALIAGDEPGRKSMLQALLKQLCPEMVIAAGTQNAEDTLLAIRMHKIDVVFLDVSPGNSIPGLKLLETLYTYDFDVVFIPAYIRQETQDDGSGTELLAPGALDQHMLMETIGRIMRKREMANMLHRPALHTDMAPPSRIALSDMYTTQFVSINDIAYLESNGSYTIFHLQNKQRYTKSRNLRYYEDALMRHLQFLRVHKSFLVNRSHVKAYRKSSQDLELSNGAVIPMSIGYRALLEHWGNDFIH